MIATPASSSLPVRDPAAAWYQAHLGLGVTELHEHAAVQGDRHQRRLTLLGPASGIPAQPGLPWAPVSFRVDDVEAFRDRCVHAGVTCSPVEGDAATCRFLTVTDLDGNAVLVVDR